MDQISANIRNPQHLDLTFSNIFNGVQAPVALLTTEKSKWKRGGFNFAPSYQPILVELINLLELYKLLDSLLLQELYLLL